MAGAYSNWWNKDLLTTNDPQEFSESIRRKARSAGSNAARTRENAIVLLLLADAGELELSNNERFELQMVVESKE
jgi:hypothetical protein